MRHAILFSVFIVAGACGTPDSSERSKGLEGADECHAAKFDYCVDVMELDEGTCEAKADQWCAGTDDDDDDGGCFATKFDHCVDVLGLDEGTCEAKADSLCAESNCEAEKFDYCVDVMGRDEADCKEAVREWCADGEQ